MKPNPKLEAEMASLGFVTIERAAERAALSPTAIRQALKRGRIASLRIGARHYVGVTSLDEYRVKHAADQTVGADYLAIGRTVARQVFAMRGDNAEVHLSEADLTAIIAIAVEISFKSAQETT